MKANYIRKAILITLFVILLSQIFTVESTNPDTSQIGVKNGDFFTFVLNDFVDASGDMYKIATDKVSGLELTTAVGGEFTLTVQNDTVTSNGAEHAIQVRFSNGTHFVDTDNFLTPTMHYISFTEWDFWAGNITADPFILWGSLYLDHTFVSGLYEFSAQVLLGFDYTLPNSTLVKLLLEMESRYEKSDGVINLLTLKTLDWVNYGLPDSNLNITRKGFIVGPIETEPVTSSETSSYTSTPPSSTTSSTISNPTSTETTTTSTTNPISTTTSSTTTIPTSSTTETTSATNTPTETVTNANTGTSSETITNTGSTSTTTTNDGSNTAIPSENASNTNSTSTPNPNTQTTQSSSTIDGTTSSSVPENSNLRSENENTTSTPEVDVPGFGLLVGASAIITIVRLVKRDKNN
ncbi:MAG: hypothetical protein ACXAD7_03075 [Candidatus Kariarchaeaceae archaeon]|jgi:hypothetical protein